MLSFKARPHGKPIAIVRGGVNNKKVIYYYDDYDASLANEINFADILDVLGENWYHKTRNPKTGKLLTESELDALENAFRTQTPPFGKYEDLVPIFNQHSEVFAPKSTREIIIHDGLVEALPYTDQKRFVGWVVGKSGSGKSYYIASQIAKYKAIEKKYPVYLFSGKDEDEVLDKHDPARIILDDDFVANPPRYQDFKNSVVVFDDVNALRSKKLVAAVRLMRDQILENGRSLGINTFCSTHSMFNWGETKSCLNESNCLTFFPKRLPNKRQLDRLLGETLGLPKSIKNKLVNLPSRWVTVCTSGPDYAVHERGCLITKEYVPKK